MQAPVHIGPAALPALADWLRDHPPSQVLVLADDHTARYCYPRLAEHLPPHARLTIPAGEAHKTLATCEVVWRWLTGQRADRHAALLCLGGGVVTDLGGFVAATYKRGLACLSVPTTLLAQVDAAVGGKTGVDFAGLKNHLGVFQEPAAVFMDPAFLATLPSAELRSGFAEVVKHALIADAAAFRALPAGDLAAVADWTPLVRHSVNLKAGIVAQDPHEAGPRKLLNFGHTVGHALEGYLLGQPGRAVTHGAAVAAGMLAESWISARRGLLAAAELAEVERAVAATFEPLVFAESEIDLIAALALQDKKNRGGVINCTLLRGIGEGVFDQPVTVAEVAAALRAYRAG